MSSFNSKLIVAEINQNTSYVVLDRQSDDVQLSLDSDKDHFLKKSQIESSIKVLKNFRKICDVYGVTRSVCIANFLPESKPKNLISFFDEVYTSCGFKFDLIDSGTQTMALYNAVINTLDNPKGVACIIELDCVKLIWYSRRNIISQIMLPFGPLTLVNMFSDVGAEKQIENIQRYIISEIKKLDLQIGEDEIQIVGAGKMFEDLAVMVKKYKRYPFEAMHGYEMDREDIEYVGGQIKTLGLDKNKKIKGLFDARADLFLVSCEIILSLINYFNSPSVVLSTNSTLEGMILSSAFPITLEKPIADIIGFSLSMIGDVYDKKDTKHNEQVANLALLLFRQLRVIHKLPRGYIKVLRSAAYLHDSGKRVGYDNHARFGFYVAMSSDIYGLSHRELILSAFVVSLHNGGEISLADWMRYNGILLEEDIEAVRKLGTILRLAENLDRSKNNVIVDINCDILGDSVIMKTESNEDNSFEITEALKVQREFERNFKKKLEIL